MAFWKGIKATLSQSVLTHINTHLHRQAHTTQGLPRGREVRMCQLLGRKFSPPAWENFGCPYHTVFTCVKYYSFSIRHKKLH